MFKGIIFDFNGTLFFDSEKHLDAWRKYSAKLRGTAFTDDEMRKYMFGRTNEDIIAYAIGEKPSKELVEQLAKEKEAVYRDMCRMDKENTVLAPGAVKLLNFLKENNIRCKNAVFVLRQDDTYVKRCSVPLMTVDQLKLNLPFEFHDYIGDELEQYQFDALMSLTYNLGTTWINPTLSLIHI